MIICIHINIHDMSERPPNIQERTIFVLLFVLIPPTMYYLIAEYYSDSDMFASLVGSSFLLSTGTMSFIGATIGAFGLKENSDRLNLGIGSGIIIGLSIAIFMSQNEILIISTIEVILLITVFTFLGSIFSPKH